MATPRPYLHTVHTNNTLLSNSVHTVSHDRTASPSGLVVTVLLERVGSCCRVVRISCCAMSSRVGLRTSVGSPTIAGAVLPIALLLACGTSLLSIVESSIVASTGLGELRVALSTVATRAITYMYDCGNLCTRQLTSKKI